MKRLPMLLAWLVIAIAVALLAHNWTALAADVPFHFFIAELRVPMGLLMVALLLVPTLLFSVALMQSRIGSLLESRRLLKELQQAHERADAAEASRIEGLRALLNAEFAALNARLDRADAAPRERLLPP